MSNLKELRRRSRKYRPLTTEEFDEHRLEIAQRLKNLLWTVSGDYSLDVKLDLNSFKKSKYISMYDAIKQGAFAKYFSSDELGLYIMKKVYLSAQERPLMELAQLCVDAASYPLIIKERSGISEIRRLAFEDILEYQATSLGQSFFGQVKGVTIMRFLRENGYGTTPKIESVLEDIATLKDAKTTMDIIRVIDRVYNNIYDKTFERKYGTLEDVLSVTLEDLSDFDWRDFLEEEAMEDVVNQYLKNLASNVTQFNAEDKPKKESSGENSGKNIRVIDEEALKKMYSYVELNHGKSYLSDFEQERINHQFCRGIHADSSLFYTDGVLHSPAKINYQYRYSEMQRSKNREYYKDHYPIIKRNIEILTDMLKKALLMRNQEDYCKSNTGQLVPSRLWKLNRSNDNRMFNKKIKADNSQFVVDILLDSSGSQSGRQPQVAAQGYIISEALSNIGIPHRVMGYCTFWDYTIMRRFREYDDDRSMNERLFEFSASSNNRDGLAIKATYPSLVNRNEDNKILIILSDGKPNDININRPNSKNTTPYEGEYAIRDTAFEVRRARALDIAVLGVFAGKEEDLAAERKIFGKDFAYIRSINNFSHVVGTYLRKQIDMD
ncbi:hypothetical protein P261_00522 [Lachnospiraceae bacterium TWA4]|nr:hypothetical protein P261_00522 [Lachnospiraceae bacterium TWA4]